jgi:hypothetical protein
MTYKELTEEDFSELFDVSSATLPAECLRIIESCDWRYSDIEGDELSELVVDIESRLKTGDMSVVTQGDNSRWVRGWGENLDDFVSSGGDVLSLVPKYIRPNMPLRLNGKFIRGVAPNFELNWFRVFQQWLFRSYFGQYSTIVELGSGSGINLATLAEIYPEKTLIGADWAEPSVRIVDEMKRLRGWHTAGRLFDFSNPDFSWEFPENTAVFTVAALEQSAQSWERLLEFLLQKKPEICIFIEPVYEWYEPTLYNDDLAMRAHTLRNFWTGFPERLDHLSSIGEAEIIKQKRSNFGSLLHEAYSQIIWRPL